MRRSKSTNILKLRNFLYSKWPETMDYIGYHSVSFINCHAITSHLPQNVETTAYMYTQPTRTRQKGNNWPKIWHLSPLVTFYHTLLGAQVRWNFSIMRRTTHVNMQTQCPRDYQIGFAVNEWITRRGCNAVNLCR